MKTLTMFQQNYMRVLEMADTLGVSILVVLRVFRAPEHKPLCLSRNSIILMQVHFILFVLRQTLACKSSKFDYHVHMFVCFIAIEAK